MRPKTFFSIFITVFCICYLLRLLSAGRRVKQVLFMPSESFELLTYCNVFFVYSNKIHFDFYEREILYSTTPNTLLEAKTNSNQRKSDLNNAVGCFKI